MPMSKEMEKTRQEIAEAYCRVACPAKPQYCDCKARDEFVENILSKVAVLADDQSFPELSLRQRNLEDGVEVQQAMRDADFRRVVTE